MSKRNLVMDHWSHDYELLAIETEESNSRLAENPLPSRCGAHDRDQCNIPDPTCKYPNLHVLFRHHSCSSLNQLLDRGFSSSHYPLKGLPVSAHIGVMLFHELAVVRFNHLPCHGLNHVKSKYLSPVV